MARLPAQVLVIPFRHDAARGWQFLVFRRRDQDCWQWVAGGVESGESVEQAALRELREETGMERAELLKLNTVASVPACCFAAAREWGPNIVVVQENCFAARVGDDNVTISGEHMECRWLAFDEAMNMLRYDSNRTALWELEQRLKRGTCGDVDGTNV